MSDVQYWLNHLRHCASWLTYREEKQTELNLKLKIGNTAGNADITQSQARDTKHRRMHEVNSLCTYSRPLPAEYCIKSIPHNTAISKIAWRQT